MTMNMTMTMTVIMTMTVTMTMAMTMTYDYDYDYDKMNLESLQNKGWQSCNLWNNKIFSNALPFFISIFMKLVKTLIFKLLFSFVTYKLTNFHSILSFCHF